MNRFSKLSLFAVALAAIGSVAYATKSMENDAMAIVNAKIPLAQAVTTAEKHANGKATRAEYEQSKQGWVYEVEVVSGAKVF
ncbi:MAG: PepSY domain-containing protein, partial [Betaproteobacteria bacterium]